MPVTPVMPKPVFDVTTPTRWESYSTTLNLITGAIGFTGVAALPAPILSANGDKVGSHWRKNPVWGFKTPVSTIAVVETATSASFNVQDETYNLEKLFEGNPAGRFVARLTIDGGSEIYGYIGDISASGNVYTFKVYNAPALGTQSWIGTLPASSRAVRKLEIFSNESSISFTTGTVLTREIPWDFAVSEQQNMMDLLATMANGDYAVDYARGKIYYKKATTATSDTIAYNTYGGSGGPTPDINLKEVNGTSTIAGQTSNTTTVTGFLNNLPMARYNASPTARTEGQFGNLQADANGNLQTNIGGLLAGEDQPNGVFATAEKPLSASTYTPDMDTSAAAEASSVTKSSTGVLYGLSTSNANAATRFMQFFNSTTVPADTTVPVIVIAVPATSTINVTFPMGRYFSTGIAWCTSTTQHTKTIAAAEMLADVRYK